MINNVLDSICTSLNLRLLIKLYKPSLDCLYITYNIAEIKKPGYKELDVFVPSLGGLSAISKTIIFVDNINERMVLTKYLYIKLSDNLKDKAKQVI